MAPLLFFTFLFLLIHPISSATTTSSSIIFATLGSKSTYAFDIFTLPTTTSPPSISDETKLTDGISLNFNGHFPNQSSTSAAISLVYVTERGGSSNIFLDYVYLNTHRNTRSRAAMEFQIPDRIQTPLLKNTDGISMKDKPSVVGDYLIYVSTHQDPGKPRASWTAVFSTELTTGLTRRLTPTGIADFSPAVSPSGVYTAVASYGESGWEGEVEELSTDIYVFLTRDGSQRVKVVDHGGWPSWMDDSTLFFHRRSEEDDWISVYKAVLPSDGPICTESVIVERVTPPGLHAFTPAASPGNNKFIAVATRRPSSVYRHIELYDLVNDEFVELTRLVSPTTHHLNPFISPDSTRVGYHRCRGASNDETNTKFMLEHLNSPKPDISLFRVDGSFPSWSPKGDRIAFVDFPGVYVVNRDGSNRKQVYRGMAFSTVWDPVRPGVVYSSGGPTFASESSSVDIISINVNHVDKFKKLTTNGMNNAFPAVSPDGKWMVFRSSRSGHKNLYIMDIVKGEKGGLHRLTKGPWSDTMCNWSPDGELIAFASDRDNPGSGSFDLYLIHPNGTALRKLVQSGLAGRTNHPYFSPDGKTIVFTTDYAGISAEPISNPHHFQPYGEIYTVKLDGSELKRLTHNSFEDGTPAWGPTYIEPEDVEWPKHGAECSFEECHWLNAMRRSHSAVQIDLFESSKQQCGA
ncbi:hypothetical protein M5689_025071 [Euphorbia peplus]|nr:hypothetical protein M5689_025071 [Euphorbia peplus]